MTELNNITSKNNTITIHNMVNSNCVYDFMRILHNVVCSKGYSDVIIISHPDGVFPNVCVPIAGIINFYRAKYNVGFSYHIGDSDYLSSCCFDFPRNFSIDVDGDSPLNRIFYYETSKQVADITQSLINKLSFLAECEIGVLDGLNWCINEVMDNVLVHSNTGRGYIMAQYHQQSHKIAICVYDSGIGIYSSMKDSSHKPKSEADAISLAIQEGVGDGKGQGNGLYGLYSTICHNKGTLSITSGGALLSVDTEGIINKKTTKIYLDRQRKSTLVDFQMNLDKGIDFDSVFPSMSCYDGRLDDLYDERKECIVYDVYKESLGTATREAGDLLRNDIMNILKRTDDVIHLDFSKVQMVSSSFIDEFIAKLFLSLGFITFNNRIRIIRMNKIVQGLCQRSLYMRIHAEWETEKRNNSVK